MNLHHTNACHGLGFAYVKENNKMYNNNYFMIHLNNIIVTYYTF